MRSDVSSIVGNVAVEPRSCEPRLLPSTTGRSSADRRTTRPCIRDVTASGRAVRSRLTRYPRGVWYRRTGGHPAALAKGTTDDHDDLCRFDRSAASRRPAPPPQRGVAAPRLRGAHVVGDDHPPARPDDRVLVVGPVREHGRVPRQAPPGQHPRPRTEHPRGRGARRSDPHHRLPNPPGSLGLRPHGPGLGRVDRRIRRRRLRPARHRPSRAPGRRRSFGRLRRRLRHPHLRHPDRRRRAVLGRVDPARPSRGGDQRSAALGPLRLWGVRSADRVPGRRVRSVPDARLARCDRRRRRGSPPPCAEPAPPTARPRREPPHRRDRHGNHLHLPGRGHDLRALRQLGPVRGVAPSTGSPPSTSTSPPGRLTVTSDTPVDPDAVRSAVEEAGYEVVT